MRGRHGVASCVRTRLGFGADHMYPVRVVCRGCPRSLGGAQGMGLNESVFEAAAIERKAAGKTVETYAHEGWSWRELDLVEEAAGGAPVAHRDALKLMAAFLQTATTSRRSSAWCVWIPRPRTRPTVLKVTSSGSASVSCVCGLSCSSPISA